jgi:hypothetical protein
MEGKVAWMIKKDLLLSTVSILDILLATWSMHHSSFLMHPPSKSQDEISFKVGGLYHPVLQKA